MAMNFRGRESSQTFLLVVFLPLAGIICLVVGSYLLKPAKMPMDAGPTVEAKAYLPHLQLSDVKMNAAENLMQQQVVYVDGTISNNGSRTIRQIDVYCLFSNVNGQEIARKRATVLNAHSAVLAPTHSRSFELPFDGLPEGWNQAMPRLIIAQIAFE